MNDLGNMKNLIISGAVVLVTVAALFMYINREPYVEESLLTSVTSDANPTTLDGSFISALNSLRGLQLNDAVFRNTVWANLTDFSQVIEPQPSGRPNPFAPVSGGVVSVQ